MNLRAVALLALMLQFSCIAYSQFLIGCDSLIQTKSGYRPALNTTGKIELYQNSSANQLLLVNNLKQRKVFYLFEYKVAEDSLAPREILYLSRYKDRKISLGQKTPITKVEKYKQFLKIEPVSYSDLAFVAAKSHYNDGIDFLERLWRVIDNNIPCELEVYLTRNSPRHSTVSYYEIGIDGACIDKVVTQTQ